MVFDEFCWAESAKKRFRAFGDWVGRSKGQDLPYLAYGGLCGAALAPVVAAAQGGEFLAAILALGKLAGGIGGGLIAKQIERWKDQAERVDEEDLRRWVVEHAENADVRTALDTILERLDALPEVQTGLAQSDRDWFVETLHGELGRLGNLERHRQFFIDVGVLNVIKIEVPPSPRDAAEALTIYRRRLVHTHGHLPLRSIDPGVCDPTSPQRPLSLASVYVDLDTTTRIEKGKAGRRRKDSVYQGEPTDERLTAMQAVGGQRKLVLLGNPGGGKSTFVSHLAYCLAAHSLEPNAGLLGYIAGWPKSEGYALPIVVILRDFARSLPDPLPSRAEPNHIWDFISARLSAENVSLARDPVQDQLEKGRALVLLDGLDEVSSEAERLFVREAVMAFVKCYPQNRYVVTCRVMSYQPPVGKDAPDLRLPGFPTFEIAPFDEQKVDRFIGAWYEELGRVEVVRKEESAALAGRLRAALRRPDLWRLAPNPLLLTVMALVHTHKGRLPDARALLYEDTVDLLLWRWEEVRTVARGETSRLRQLLLDAGRAEVDLKRVLSRVAFNAHSQVDKAEDAEKLADVGEQALMKALASLKAHDYTWADEVIQALKLRAGLLLERAPGFFTFPHRTFQEYLAGSHLASESDFGRKASWLAEAGLLWRDVILMAIGRLVYVSSDLDKPLVLVGELCPERVTDHEVSWRKAWLAGDVLLEVGTERVEDGELGRDLVARVRGRLVDLIAGAKLAPRERAAAGATLGSLGDPRGAVATLDGIEFCLVPGGGFWMGGREYDDEKPMRLNTYLGGDYWIGRFPVANAQFAAFVSEGGYAERRYWQEAESAGVWRNGSMGGHSDDRGRTGPVDWGSPYDLRNHPVVGLTWYEALAFCRWLTEHWRAKGLLPLGWAVQLPSEAEWEKAARGGEKVPGSKIVKHLPLEPEERERVGNEEPKREFPWGSEPDPNCANCDDTGIGTTSAVGCFPGGASAYGCEEMSGNVWEWTRSLWGREWGEPEFKYPYNPQDGREDLEAGPEVLRVLRGGSFVGGRGGVRCAYRYGYNPDSHNALVGFRVVASPLPL